MFGKRFFGRRFFGLRWFGKAPPMQDGAHFGERYFGTRYFGTRYFGGNRSLVDFSVVASAPIQASTTLGLSSVTIGLGLPWELSQTAALDMAGAGVLSGSWVSDGGEWAFTPPLVLPRMNSSLGIAGSLFMELSPTAEDWYLEQRAPLSLTGAGTMSTDITLEIELAASTYHFPMTGEMTLLGDIVYEELPPPDGLVVGGGWAPDYTPTIARNAPKKKEKKSEVLREDTIRKELAKAIAEVPAEAAARRAALGMSSTLSIDDVLEDDLRIVRAELAGASERVRDVLMQAIKEMRLTDAARDHARRRRQEEQLLLL